MQESLIHDAKFWVAAAFVLFVALSYKKISTLLLKALDDRSAKIAHDLSEARRLREEAEAVLADYKRKQAEYLKEAEAMLIKARADADLLTKQSEKELKDAMEARTKQALDKIAREEDHAIMEVRNHVVDIALAAARAVIVSHVGKLSQEELVRLAMVDIERKIH